MTPRPRTVSNSQIVAAVIRGVSEHGPARMTLADVAGQVGLTPAALVQRFGSKRALLLHTVRASNAALHARFAAIRAAHASPLSALLNAATSMSRHVRTPEQLANHLAFLQVDLQDPEFHAEAESFFRVERQELRALAEAARDAGELRADVDAAAIARAVQVAMNGSRVVWAVLREGELRDSLQRDVEWLLQPYRAA